MFGAGFGAAPDDNQTGILRKFSCSVCGWDLAGRVGPGFEYIIITHVSWQAVRQGQVLNKCTISGKARCGESLGKRAEKAHFRPGIGSAIITAIITAMLKDSSKHIVINSCVSTHPMIYRNMMCIQIMLRGELAPHLQG